MFYLKKILGNNLEFFLIFVLFFFAPFISRADTSPVTTTVSITAIVAGTTTEDIIEEEGGVSGGGYIPIMTAPSISFSGIAYPFAPVTLLLDGQDLVTVYAGIDAKFFVGMPSLPIGSYTFSFSATDSHGRRSIVYTIPVKISDNLEVSINGVYIPPSISVSQGISNFKIEGETAPGALVNIYIDNEPIPSGSIFSDMNGKYEKDFSYSGFLKGFHFAKSNFSSGGVVSVFSRILNFPIGVPFGIADECDIPADLSDDCRVNLVDFSILAYWYKRDAVPESVDLNNDQKVDMSDFSIMAYYWTG